jgi:hypothetical protein
MEGCIDINDIPRRIGLHQRHEVVDVQLGGPLSSGIREDLADVGPTPDVAYSAAQVHSISALPQHRSSSSIEPSSAQISPTNRSFSSESGLRIR